jgi:hypothetical protein
MDYSEIVSTIAKILKDYDTEMQIHKKYQPGIGPFGEPQLVKAVAQRLTNQGITAKTKRTPDLEIGSEWAIEFKIVRPFGDNGIEAENWSVNLLHPYAGNQSHVGDALKLLNLDAHSKIGLFVIGFEHDQALNRLNPLLASFEAIAEQVIRLNLAQRIEERRAGLVHPVHQVLRCIGWQLVEQ